MTNECPKCCGPVAYLDQTCSGCGADLALEMEIEAFHTPAINSARKMILFASIAYLVIPVIPFAMFAQLLGWSVFATSAFWLTFGIGAAIFGAHIALRWWATKSPFPATLVALAIFIAYAVATGITSGLVPKVFGLVILGRAVMAGYRVHKLRAQAESTQPVVA